MHFNYQKALNELSASLRIRNRKIVLGDRRHFIIGLNIIISEQKEHHVHHACSLHYVTIDSSYKWIPS